VGTNVAVICYIVKKKEKKRHHRGDGEAAAASGDDSGTEDCQRRKSRRDKLPKTVFHYQKVNSDCESNSGVTVLM